MRAISVGRISLALSFAVIGVISLVARDFVLYQEPVPASIPWRATLACFSGALMLTTGVGLLAAPVARLSALVLTAFVSLWVLALELPRAVAQPWVEVYWLGVGEDLTLVAGGWILFCSPADSTVTAARIVFGLALIPIGLSHFFYLKDAVEFIPAWMPFRVPLTWFTGAAHIVAGVAIAFGVVPWLAATLEAVMESLVTLIVWVSAVVAHPTHRDPWVNLFISTALSAAAWAVAGSYVLSYVSSRESPHRAEA